MRIPVERSHTRDRGGVVAKTGNSAADLTARRSETRHVAHRNANWQPVGPVSGLDVLALAREPVGASPSHRSAATVAILEVQTADSRRTLTVAGAVSE